MPSSSRTSTRRYLKGELTREQILWAAKKLFTENGYHNTSIYDLFEKAGITKGAFYHHWKTKEDLALTILEEMKSAYESRLFPILQGAGRGRNLIEETLKTITELNARSDWCYCKLMATWSSELAPDQDPLGRAVHEMRRQWLDHWKGIFERAQVQGDLRTDIPPEELSFLMVCTICGVFLTEKAGANGSKLNPLDTLRRIILT